MTGSIAATRGRRRVIRDALLLVLLVLCGLVVVATARGNGLQPRRVVAIGPEDLASLPVETPAPPPQAAPPPVAPVLPPVAQPASHDPMAASAAAFAADHPAQAAAVRDLSDPAGDHWAVLIGINDYAGRVRDNIGSAQDAILLRDALVANGWRQDHILLLTDRAATHDRVVRALEWLIRSTGPESTVVVSYSGHTRQQRGDPDGDGEAFDEALWAADNAYLWDADLARMLGAIRAGHVWVTIQACEAAGFGDPGLEGPGRVVTYSSREDQKSYEDPEVGMSVQGFYFLNEGLAAGFGDRDGDGVPSVQEAHVWSRDRTGIRTSQRQSPVLVDGLGSPFTLTLGG